MKGLELSAKKNTVSMILTVLLYAVGAFSVPYEKIAELFGGTDEMVFAFGFICKVICSLLPVYLIFQFGFSKILKIKPLESKGLLFCVPALVVAVDNFPFAPIILGNMSINGPFLKIITYLLFCFSIALLEESVFRGIIFPLCLYKTSRDKRGTFLAVIISSAIFGATHLLNLFGGFSPVVFLQVGYSFLIGCMCCLTALFTGRLWYPIIIHFIFDAGGFLSDYFGQGVLWTTENVVLTTIISVICAAILAVLFFKNDYSSIFDEWKLNDFPKKNGNTD